MIWIEVYKPPVFIKDDRIWLQVSPIKGVMRFQKKAKP